MKRFSMETIGECIGQIVIGIQLIVAAVKLSAKVPTPKKRHHASDDYSINGELVDEGEYFSRSMEKED